MNVSVTAVFKQLEATHDSSNMQREPVAPRYKVALFKCMYVALAFPQNKPGERAPLTSNPVSFSPLQTGHGNFCSKILPLRIADLHEHGAIEERSGTARVTSALSPAVKVAENANQSFN